MTAGSEVNNGRGKSYWPDARGWEFGVIYDKKPGSHLRDSGKPEARFPMCRTDADLCRHGARTPTGELKGAEQPQQ